MVISLSGEWLCLFRGNGFTPCTVPAATPSPYYSHSLQRVGDKAFGEMGAITPPHLSPLSQLTHCAPSPAYI